MKIEKRKKKNKWKIKRCSYCGWELFQDQYGRMCLNMQCLEFKKYESSLLAKPQ